MVNDASQDSTTREPMNGEPSLRRRSCEPSEPEINVARFNSTRVLPPAIVGYSEVG